MDLNRTRVCGRSARVRVAGEGREVEAADSLGETHGAKVKCVRLMTCPEQVPVLPVKYRRYSHDDPTFNMTATVTVFCRVSCWGTKTITGQSQNADCQSIA